MLFSEPKIPQSRHPRDRLDANPKFQCSSASRKFLNCARYCRATRRQATFQCSSASRKFLNNATKRLSVSHQVSFSALQRAENSSILPQFRRRRCRNKFQCSSASRKFLNSYNLKLETDVPVVSVLFSEPKIPQSDPRTCVHPYSRLRRSRFVVPEPSWCVAMTPVY